MHCLLEIHSKMKIFQYLMKSIDTLFNQKYYYVSSSISNSNLAVDDIMELYHTNRNN